MLTQRTALPRAMAGHVVAACLCAAGPVHALDFPGPVQWSGVVTIANDSVHRGVTWSDGRAVVAAELGASTDQGWNASVGVESPSYPDYGGRGGLTLAVAKAWQIDADWRAQSSLTHYAFAGREAARAAGHTELGLAWGWQGRVFLSAALSPDRRTRDNATGQVRSARAAAVEIGFTQPIDGRLALDAGIGNIDHFIGGRRRGYRYGSIALRWGVGPVQAQFGWVTSDAARQRLAPPGAAGSRVLAQLGWVF